MSISTTPTASTAMHEPLLEISDLRVGFGVPGREIEAIRGISLEVAPGEVLGIVGESGSGKSIAMLSALGLQPPSAHVTGSARFQGQELIGMPLRKLRRLRGSRIAMIFQDPLSSLNPVMTIGAQIIEALRLHNPGMSKQKAAKRATELLSMVSISQPDQRLHQYPHEFSGGMRQRVMIAMAVANEPALLIADEPTTALDVTVQAQIMEVLSGLQARLNIGLILITHDLGVLAGHAHRVAVVYAGEIVEEASIDEIFSAPQHPYTRGLIASIPNMARKVERLYSIEGTPPPLGQLPPGCAFHPRCAEARPICARLAPKLRTVGAHVAACHFAFGATGDQE